MRKARTRIVKRLSSTPVLKSTPERKQESLHETFSGLPLRVNCSLGPHSSITLSVTEMPPSFCPQCLMHISTLKSQTSIR